MRTALRVVALSIVAVVALSGCVRMNVNLELQSDNTVDGTMVVAIQKGAGEAFGMSDEDVLEQLNSESSGDFESSTTEPYDQDGYIGTVTSFSGESIDSISNDVGNEGMTIVREGDYFIVAGPLDVNEEETEGLTAGAEMTMSVTFPGEVVEHNGTLEGNTVTWNLLDAPAEINAKGRAVEGGAFPTTLVIIIAAGALLVALAVVIMVVVRGRSKVPDAGSPAATAAAEADLPSATGEFGPTPTEGDIAPEGQEPQ